MNNENQLRKFRLHWLTGENEDITTYHSGNKLEAMKDATMKAGIGGGAFRALDYWEEVTSESGVDDEQQSDRT